MSAAPLVPKPHSCGLVRQACIDVLRRGRRPAMACVLKASLDTIDRLRAETAPITIARVDDLQRYEEADLKTETIRAARLAEAVATEGNALSAISDVSADIGESAEIIAIENVFLSHGGRDPREAIAIAKAQRIHAMHLLHAAADLEAFAERARC